MNNSKFIDPILREVAKEQGLPLYVIQEIYESPFKFMREDTKIVGNWKTYLIQGLGKFRPVVPILKKIKNGEEINNFVKKSKDESK
jgi:hypothetical protein